MKSFISRIVALLLAMTMLMGVTAFAEQLEYSNDSPKLLGIFSQSQGEWYADEFNRGLLATATLMDLILSQKEAFSDAAIAGLSQDEVFVATGDDMLTIFYFGANTMVTCYYFPATNHIYCYLDNTWNPSLGSVNLLNSLQGAGSIESYYQVSASYIWGIYSAILEALEE